MILGTGVLLALVGCARVHNGTVVHENVEVTGTTRAGAWEDEKPKGPLMLQGDHGPVAFRSIRIRPLRDQ